MGIKIPFGLPFSRAKPEKLAAKSINPDNNIETVYIDKSSGLLVELYGSVMNPNEDMLTELNNNLATELANATFKADDKVLTRRLNVRPNKMANSVEFWTEFWKRTLKTGIGVIRVRDMRIIPVSNKKQIIKNFENETIEIIAVMDDKKRKFKFDVDELIIVEIDIPKRNATTQIAFVKKIKDFISSLAAKKVKNVFKADADLSERERAKYQKQIDASDENLLIDSTFESYQAVNHQSTFDQKEFDAALKLALNSRKVPLEIYNMNYTQGEYSVFYFSFLMLKLQQLEVELRQKLDDSIRIYHKSLANLSAEQLKTLGMLGVVTIDEVREWYGKGPIPGGDKLIENWNEKNTEKKGEKDGKKVRKTDSK